MSLGTLLGGMIVFAFIILIVVIVIYVLLGIYLNKFNKLVYGKGTALAWIPLCNIYLLGKLSFNKIVGAILIVFLILTTQFTTTVDGIESTFSIIPAGPILEIVSPLYGLAVFAIFIYSLVKYSKLKKSYNNLNNNAEQNINTTPIDNSIQQVQTTVGNTQQPVTQAAGQPIQNTTIAQPQPEMPLQNNAAQTITNNVTAVPQQPIQAQPIQQEIQTSIAQPIQNTVIQPQVQPIQEPVVVTQQPVSQTVVEQQVVTNQVQQEVPVVNNVEPTITNAAPQEIQQPINTTVAQPTEQPVTQQETNQPNQPVA